MRLTQKPTPLGFPGAGAEKGTGVKVNGVASNPTSSARLKFSVARALRNMPSRRSEKALSS